MIDKCPDLSLFNRTFQNPKELEQALIQSGLWDGDNYDHPLCVLFLDFIDELELGDEPHQILSKPDRQLKLF